MTKVVNSAIESPYVSSVLNVSTTSVMLAVIIVRLYGRIHPKNYWSDLAGEEVDNMRKRIMIEWDHDFDPKDNMCSKCFQAPGEEIEGTVTINTVGKVLGWEEKVRVVFSRSSSTIKPIEGTKVLPDLTEEEDRIIRVMGRSYLAGMSREHTIEHWTVTDQV